MILIYILLACGAVYWFVFKVIIPPIALKKLVDLLSKNVENITERIGNLADKNYKFTFASEIYANLLQESSPKHIWLRILARKPSPYASNSENKEFTKLAIQMKEILVDLDWFMVKDSTCCILNDKGDTKGVQEVREEMENDLVTLNQRIADIKKVLGEN